jgi:hypothetical protein
VSTFVILAINTLINKQTDFVVLVRKRTISTERSSLFGEVSANFCG